MSLNHLVIENIKYDPKLNVRFKTTLIDDNIEFKDDLLYNGQILTQLFNGLNTLYFRNQSNNLVPLSSGKQRIFQQLAPNFNIGTGTGETVMIDTNGAIGSLEIPANSTTVGNKFIFEGHGTLVTASANHICRIRVRIGGIMIGDSGNQSLPNLASSSFYDYKIKTLTYQIGSPGIASIKCFGTFHFIDQQGDTHTIYVNTDNNTTYETITTQTLTITFEWVSTGSDQLSVHTNTVYRLQ